jgi:hypothetical protein
MQFMHAGWQPWYKKSRHWHSGGYFLLQMPQLSQHGHDLAFITASPATATAAAAASSSSALAVACGRRRLISDY